MAKIRLKKKSKDINTKKKPVKKRKKKKSNQLSMNNELKQILIKKLMDKIK